MSYIGRFAPSPTGSLHAGSLVAALASWLDARAHGGTWLVRMEDVDTTRAVPGAAEHILRQLADLGMLSDAAVWVQSERSAVYAAGLAQLVEQGLAYPCTCSRTDIATAYAARGLQRARGADWVYPGTCRLRPLAHDTPAAAWRFDYTQFLEKYADVAVKWPHNASISIAKSTTQWQDRALGMQQQDVAQAVGDFVLQRADGVFSYQLAVVLDDAAQGITHVVRGADLADNTARQIALQTALGLPTPQYLHTPLVTGSNGEKLSKQNGAQALDTTQTCAALLRAAQMLDLPLAGHWAGTPTQLLHALTQSWQHRWQI